MMSQLGDTCKATRKPAQTENTLFSKETPVRRSAQPSEPQQPQPQQGEQQQQPASEAAGLSDNSVRKLLQSCGNLQDEPQDELIAGKESLADQEMMEDIAFAKADALQSIVKPDWDDNLQLVCDSVLGLVAASPFPLALALNSCGTHRLKYSKCVMDSSAPLY